VSDGTQQQAIGSSAHLSSGVDQVRQAVHVILQVGDIRA
jgi:hypothetical protein